MREKLLSKLMLLLAFVLVGAGNAWADTTKTSTLTFTAKCEGSGTADDGVKWTVESDGTESNFDNDKGIHYGTNKAAVQAIKLSTNDISGTITKIVVNASAASGVSASLYATVNDVAFGTQGQAVSATATEYTFEGSAASGLIEVKLAKPESAQKALYIKSVAVTYTTSGNEPPVMQTVATPTFNPAAGEVEAGTEVTIATTTEGAAIYYTVDGTDPTTNSTKGNTVKVEKDMTIKAIAVKEGMNNSAVATATYTIKAAVVPVEGEFVLYTGAITPGDYIIYYDGKAMKAGTASNRFQYEKVVPENNTIINPDEGIVWTLAASDEYYTLYNASTGKYAASTGTKNQGALLEDGTDDKALWTVTGTDEDTYEFVNKQNAAANVNANLRNNGTYGFACYAAGTGGALSLYKKSEGTQPTPETAKTTTVTIDATGITNTNLFAGTAAGKLTAIVKAGDKVIEGAVVAWESDNEDVASVGNDGTVTLESAGTAVITASYAGVKDQYKPSEATYTLTVTNDDPNAAGTADNPYSVAQARAAIDAGAGVTGVYAKGIVSEIVTEFNPQYGNITYNISEDGTTTGDQLQAYRGKGKDGANFTSEDDIKVGDIVVVYGNLKKYNTTYEFDADNQLVSLERVNTSISADNIDIAFDATTGAIAYTIDNPTDQGIMSATTTSDWLTLANDFSSPIAFTCETNSDGVSRTAIVTLTYTFGNEKVTKEVTVTQAGNPDVVNNISDITEVDVAYSVRGTVVATNARGFVIGDGTGYIYYYKNSAPAQAVGDKVSISGTTGTYGKIIQFTSTATVAEAASSNYNNTPAATVITEVPDYTKEYHLSTYLQFEGKLTKNGSNYLIALGEEQIQISYPTEAQQAELGELEGKTVQVKGYFSGINSSAKFTVMLEGVEEVITNDPFINAEDVELEYDATTGEIAFTIDNPVTGTVLTASATADWITRVAVNGDKVIFATTANEGDADRTATITLVYGEVTKDVTVTQKHYVVDYATLPFVWEGGAKDVFLTVNGVTANGLGSDYAESHAPYRMKFDTTDDYIQVKTNVQPGRVTIGVKMIGGANKSKITVQGSADGEEFTDVQELTISGSQNSVLTLATTKFFAEDCRYVRLVFTKGSNVGIGAISIDEPISYVEATVGEAGYATFCSSWALELPENVTAYIVSAVSESNVTLTEVTAIPANTPVILKAEANSYELPIIEDADAVEGNMLLASDGTVQGDGASIFALGNKGEVGFYLVANGVTVPAGKAYLVVTAAVRDFLAFANGEADGINAVDNGQFAVGNVVYDLSGRRVEKAVKGIYIVNGKKVVK